MTDLHCHILPGMDDGAKNPTVSLKMLQMEAEQGVDTVVLTPHFYRDMERPSHFLQRRKEAMALLQERIDSKSAEERSRLPRLLLGAEVAWVPNMASWPELDELCYEGTSFLLVEPPMQPWSEMLFQQLYDILSRRNLTPVIAHIDRYWDQKRDMLEQLLSFGFPVQISAETFLHFPTRGKALKYVKTGSAQLLISDSHNLNNRVPNLGPAMEVLRRKLGDEAEGLFRQTDRLLYH